MGNEEFYHVRNIVGTYCTEYNDLNSFLEGRNADFRVGPPMDGDGVANEFLRNPNCAMVGVYLRNNVGQSPSLEKALKEYDAFVEVEQGLPHGSRLLPRMLQPGVSR